MLNKPMVFNAFSTKCTAERFLAESLLALCLHKVQKNHVHNLLRMTCSAYIVSYLACHIPLSICKNLSFYFSLHFEGFPPAEDPYGVMRWDRSCYISTFPCSHEWDESGKF